jgi:diaminopimelate epimerase
MKATSALSVTRMSGARNTFFVVNVFEPAWAKAFTRMLDADKREMARRLCKGFFGFHTDGILFLKPEKKVDFAWDFFNSDGSTAEMCGNAARCAALFFYQRIQMKKTLQFLTSAGEISGEVLSDHLVRVQMTKVFGAREQTVLGQAGFYVNTGVPHFVLEKPTSAELAKSLRQVSDFGPPGANITFVEKSSPQNINAVTFERGVENFTEACGTGAVAASMYLQQKIGKQEAVQVHMPGGILKVENILENERPFLTGEAQIEFDLINWEQK